MPTNPPFQQLHHSTTQKQCLLNGKALPKTDKTTQKQQSYAPFQLHSVLDGRPRIATLSRIGAIERDRGCLCHEPQPNVQSSLNSLPFAEVTVQVQMSNIGGTLPMFVHWQQSGIAHLTLGYTYQTLLIAVGSFLLEPTIESRQVFDIEHILYFLRTINHIGPRLRLILLHWSRGRSHDDHSPFVLFPNQQYRTIWLTADSFQMEKGQNYHERTTDG